MFNILKKIKKIFDPNEWELKKLRKEVEKVNELEPQIEKLTDEELKNKTQEFKKRLADGETTDDIMYEAFAVVREASRRTLEMRPFDVQILGGVVLHQGRVTEMKTGEGKTLTATMPVYLNAVTGKGTHVVTVNDYLAKRDARWMGTIYHFLGLSVGVIQHDVSYIYDPSHIVGDESLDQLKNVHRREAYAADITYGTNNEFGFDYLRDNMVMDENERVQRELHYAIIDEVDSILIDEARTPLIISGYGSESSDDYKRFARIASRLQKDTHYTVFEKEHSVVPTEEGYRRIAEYLGLPKKRTEFEYRSEPLVVFPDISDPNAEDEKDKPGDNGKVRKLFDKGNSYIKKKKYSSAIKLFDEITEKEPENIGAWVKKGVAYDKWGKSQESVKAIQQAIHYNPDLVSLLSTSGLNYKHLKEIERELFREKEEPKKDAAEDKRAGFIRWYNKGNDALNNKDEKGAIPSYNRALGYESNHAEAYSNLGVAYYRQGETQKALENLQKAAELLPDSPDIWFNLGFCYRYSNMFEKAGESYLKAIQLRPDYIAANNNYAVACMKLDDKATGLEFFEKAMELEKNKSGEEDPGRESVVKRNYEEALESQQALDEDSHSKFPGYQVSDMDETNFEYYIQNSLKAKELFKKDVDYVIKENQVIIVDEFTGRLMFGRRYSDGLHQAIEAKENVKVRSEDQTLASITFQNYFRMYEKLAGMTGTAATEEKEFKQIYNMDVVVVPTNKPNARDDMPDRIYKNEEIKHLAVINEIDEMHKLGRPVLVGTRSIEKSELFARMLKKRSIKHNVLNAKHHEKEAQIIAEAGKSGAVTIATNMAGRGVDIVLGGVPPSYEAEERKYQSAKSHLDLVKSQVDIQKVALKGLEEKQPSLLEKTEEIKQKLSELTNSPRSDETQKQIDETRERLEEADKELSEVNFNIRDLKNRIQVNVTQLPELEKALEIAEKNYLDKKKEVSESMKDYVREQETVKKAGGLHIIGTERHESRRIDNQLRGRSGRQGDKGSSRFFVALDDELMRLFGSDKLPDWLKDWSEDENVPLEHGLFTSSIQKAQERVEMHHFSIRKNVLDYDNVMNEQRKVIYGQRDRIIKGEDLKPVLMDFIDAYVDQLMVLYAPEGFEGENWDLDSLFRSVKDTFIPIPKDASQEELAKLTRDEIREKIDEWAMFAYQTREDEMTPQITNYLIQWVLLHNVDQKWMDHLQTMDQLREGISLRAYGQRDPLVEYINESHEYFEAMNQSIQHDTVKQFFRSHINPAALEHHFESKVKVTREHRGSGEGQSTTVRKGKKVGRNDPCPCGSGKKFKRCCGRA